MNGTRINADDADFSLEWCHPRLKRLLSERGESLLFFIVMEALRTILQGMWGYAAVEDERTVNVYIRRLRGKVELNPSQPTLILTAPGMGYRLIH